MQKQPINQELYHYIFEHPFLPSTRFSEATAAAMNWLRYDVRHALCVPGGATKRMQTALFTLGHSPILHIVVVHPLCRRFALPFTLQFLLLR